MGRPRLFDLDAAIASALGVFWTQGYAATTPAELLDALFKQYKIHSKTINLDGLKCLRVTPHVYTTIADLDKFVAAIGELAAAKNA